MMIRVILLLLVVCGSVLTNAKDADGKSQHHGVEQNQVSVVEKKENIEANNWEEIWKIVNEKIGATKKNILFLVDVDNVLTFTNHPCTYPDNFKTHYSSLKKKTPKEMNDTWGKVFMNEPQKVIDDCAELVINDWQKRGGKVIGFTALVAGENGEIIERRNDNLRVMFGIRPVLTKHQRMPDAVFYPSCISTDGEKLGKGIALCKFLSIMKNKPKIIVFIDDSEKNLENVRKELPSEYTFIAIHYTGYKTQIPRNPVTRAQFKKFWSQYFK
jgi:hypothetical protein